QAECQCTVDSQRFQQKPGPGEDALGSTQKIEGMAGRGHIDHHFFGFAAQQIENAEDREDFVHTGRDAVEELSKKLPLEPEVYVYAGAVGASGIVDKILDAGDPVFE